MYFVYTVSMSLKKCLLIMVVLAAGIVFGWHMLHPKKAIAPQHANNPATVTAKKTQKKPLQPSFDASLFSTTDPTSPWVVVNKQHALQPNSYAPTDLTSIGAGQVLRAEAAQSFTAMQQVAAAAGISFSPASSYRSYNTQVSVYNNYVSSYGQAEADTFSARPGYSEHQTGWAVDIASAGCSLDNCFASTEAGKWLVAHAYEYGFILRYPDGLTNTTGYMYESWHYRYVGTALAAEMRTKGITTLETFFSIPGGTSY